MNKKNPSVAKRSGAARFRMTFRTAAAFAGVLGAAMPQHAGAIDAEPPPIPTGLTVPSTSHDGTYGVTWNPSANATSYVLQERKGSGSWLGIYSGSATGKAISGKSDGTYSYRVRACKLSGSICSNWSASRSIIVDLPPPVPSLSVPSTDYNGAYTVSWSASTGADKYQLHERFNSGSWYLLYSGLARSKSRSSRSPGTWSYRVRACHGTNCSSWSGTRTVTVPPPPSAPTGLMAPTSDNDGAYTISWNASSGASSYRLQEQVGTTWSQIYSGSLLTRSVSGRTTGQYAYRVRACNAEAVCGAWSSTRTVQVVIPPDPPSSLSSDLSVVPYGGTYHVRWSQSIGVTSYQLQEQRDAGAWTTIPSGTDLIAKRSSMPQGTYSYRVRACTSVCSVWTGGLSVTVLGPQIEPPATAPAPAAKNDPGAASAAESDTIGSTAGNFRVNESGAATYTIPIATAEGTAGVEPQISLIYSSGNGNNIAGIGWSIGGLSSITRCRQTLDQDRNVSAISFTSVDRFCLDGTRLLLTSAHSYGAAGSVYRGEIDDGSIVTAIGSTSGEPDYFEVKRRDGSISYYGRAAGNADTSAKLGDGVGRTLTWAIRQFKDSVGNSIWFEYDTSNGGQRISAIKWAYGANVDPISGYGAKLEFFYESRLDRKSGYVDGKLFENDKRLKTIISYNNVNQEIRRYNLRYNESIAVTSDDISRLTSIEECVATTCLPKTTFAWILPPTSPSWSTIGSFSMGSNVAQFKPADINGDGRMDLVWVYGSAGGYQLKYALSTGSGYSVTPFSSGSTSLSLGQFIEAKIKVIDYNLDGRQDVLLHEVGAGWKVLLSRPLGGSSWRLSSSMVATPVPENVTFIDVDSNGTTDVLSGDFDGSLHLRRLQRDPLQTDASVRRYAYTGQIPVAGLETGCFGAISEGAPDFNGDGQVDAAIIVAPEPCQYPWFIGPVTAVTFSGFTGTSPAISHYHEFPSIGLQSPDVNSDGLSDAFYMINLDAVGNADMRLAINRGDGTFIGVNDLTDVLTDHTVDSYAQFADWNMDGYPDLLWRDSANSGTLRVRYWNPDTGQLGSSFIVNSAVSSSEFESIAIFDANGDAVPDLVRVNADGNIGSVLVSTRMQGTIAAFAGVNRIKSITNGLGATTDVVYEPLSYSEHYERLEVTSSPGTGQICKSGSTFCWDDPVQVPNIGEFYEAVNGDWDYPTTWHFLAKSSPIIEMSGPLYVVTKVESDAPSAGLAPGTVNTAASSSISYFYGEAKVQAAGRGFLGFQRLTTVDDQSGVKTTTRYRQDWPFIGYPISTIVSSSAGHTLSTSMTNWEIVEWDTDSKQIAAEFGTAELGPLHVVPVEHEETTYDLVLNGNAQGSKLVTVTTESSFDAEGNASSITVTTKNGSGQVVKSVQTANVYDTTSFERWEGRLTSTTVTSGASNRKSSFDYYPSGALRGLLWKETIEPNTQYALVTEHSYDARGNRIKSSSSGGSAVRCDAITSTFDSRYRYVDVTRDCLGRTKTDVTARNKYGAPTSVETYVDATASFTTHIAYSALGREYYRYREDGSSETSYLTGTTTNCPAGTAYKALKSSVMGSESQQCFDVLARVTRTLTRGFDGQWDAQDTEYDEFGRVKRKSEPYDVSGGAQYWTTFQYDLLGRVSRTDLPDGSYGTTTYPGLTTVETAHTTVGNLSRTEVRNAAGELIQVIDNLGGSTEYGYDDQGNLTSVTDDGGNLSTMQYDVLGRKILSNDLDKGIWTYDYNHFGDLILQTDAKGQTSTMTYDGLGRTKTRVDKLSNGVIESSTVWTYDTAAYGLGQLASVQDTVSGFMRAMLYDSLGRISEVITNFNGGAYYELTTYDQFGRVFQVFDAAGDETYTSDGIVNLYNPHGYLEGVGDAVRWGFDPRLIYRRIVAMNARGQVTVEERGIDLQHGTGPAVTTTYSYSPATGRLQSISGVNQSFFDVQDLQYTWDQLGNLRKREEYSGSKALTETFGYDGLNRLTSQAVAGQGTVTLTYDLLGNITTKSDVGTYAYTSSRPHAVTTAGSATYGYDANGNNISGDGRILKYTTFDKPYEITKGSHTVTFAYGPERARYLRVDEGSDGITTTRYIGNVELIDRPDGTQVRRRYIAGVAIEDRTVSGGVESGRTTRYVHKDHLGSLDVLTDASGAVVQELSFDAWGQRRNATNWSAIPLQALSGFDSSLMTRGFTGHEMLDEVGLIHMNGRVYDPKLARFLQADPFVQDPTNSQSLNRYSYVWNNPLNATDPTGHFLGFLIAGVIFGKVAHELEIPILSSIASIAICASTAGFGCATTFAFGSTLGAGGSFSDAFKNGLFAGLSAAAFSGIAEAFDGTGFWAQGGAGHIGAHALAGGVLAELQGGKFGHGFLSAGLTKAINLNRLMPGSNRQLDIQRTVAAAVVGGTISEVSGGKFANGAITAAFAQAYNGNKQAAAEAKAMEDRWNEFVDNEEEITAQWNKDNYPSPFRISPKKFWRKLLGKGLIEAYEFHDWQMNKAVYNKGIDSFEAYRTFPPSGHRRRTLFGEWAAVMWKNYDFGGTVKQTVDFYYWHNDMGDLRPADCYVAGSC